mgnify:CR=1 FL=1
MLIYWYKKLTVNFKTQHDLERINIMKFEIGMEVLIDGITWAVVDEIFDDGQNAIVIDEDGEDHEVQLKNVDFLR